MKFNIQEQKWHDFTRIMFYNADATVQLELYKKPEGLYKITAFIYALWVNEDARRKGLATQLLDLAEDYALCAGYKNVHLEWSRRDTPIDILDWYKSRDYEICGVNGASMVLQKELKKNTKNENGTSV